MFNPLYERRYLNNQTANKMDNRIMHNIVLILSDGKEILIDSYYPNKGGYGWAKYPFKQIKFTSISELLQK